MAYKGSLDFFRVLIKAQADLDALDSNNKTPLDTAFAHDALEIVKEIIDIKGYFCQSKDCPTFLDRSVVSSRHDGPVLAGLLTMGLPVDSCDK